MSRIRTILEALSLEVATPAEARATLALKGGDQVAFLSALSLRAPGRASLP